MGDRPSADALRWNLDLGPRSAGRGHGRFARGASGFLCRDYKGKEADRLVTPIDPGVVSLVAEYMNPKPGKARKAERLAESVPLTP